MPSSLASLPQRMTPEHLSAVYGKEWPQTFKAAFCARWGCRPEEYELRAFEHCLNRHAVLLAPFFKSRAEAFFREDFDLLREISEVRNLSVLKQEVSRFYGRNLRDKNWVRRTFRIRISGQRVIDLCNELFD